MSQRDPIDEHEFQDLVLRHFLGLLEALIRRWGRIVTEKVWGVLQRHRD